MIVGVIPARYASTRLPGKPLIDLHGRTMIEHVWRAAKDAEVLDRVLVATDDHRVAAEAMGFGAEVVLTSPDLASGSDRCDAAIRQLRLTPSVVVNIQGDEPLLPSSLILHLVDGLQKGADVATPVSPIGAVDELASPTVVKVVRGADGRALYFSRAAIPFRRDITADVWLDGHTYWKHIGMYAFTWDALRRHVSLPPSPLERAEALEQLRLLEDGAIIRCVETDEVLIGVDTAADAERVRDHLRRR